jgi:hypothetical protein
MNWIFGLYLNHYKQTIGAKPTRLLPLTQQEVIETVLKSKNQVMATKVRTMFDIVVV